MIMLATPISHTLRSWQKPILVQPKIDGVRAILEVRDDAYPTLRTRNNNLIETVPHILFLAANDLKPGIYDGELYHESFNRTIEIVKRKSMHPDFCLVEYHIFDLITEDPQHVRLKKLDDLMKDIPPSGSIKTVRTLEAFSYEEVLDLVGVFTSEGFEGIIVRNKDGLYKDGRSTDLMKYKPMKNDEYKIAGVIEQCDKDGYPLGIAGSFVCVDQNGNTFRAGLRLDHSTRRLIWENKQDYIGKRVIVRYQELTHKGVPRFPVVYTIYR